MQYDLSIIKRRLDGLITFLAIAETLSFREAGKRLNVTPSAVSQTLRKFEQALGAQLVMRTTRSVSLSEAGQRLLEQVRPGIESLAEGMEGAPGDGQVRGNLRLNVPRPLMPLLLNRLLPEFWASYPAVNVELVGDDGLVDIVGEGFDAGIRSGPVPADMMSVRFSPPFRLVVVGSPHYLDRRGRPEQADEFIGHHCIRQRTDNGALYPWTLRIDEKDQVVSVDGPLVLNDAVGCVVAAVKGLGLAYAAEPLTAPYLATGRLEIVAEQMAVIAPGLTLYYPRQAKMAPKVRAFIDFAAKRMRKEFTQEDYLI